MKRLINIILCGILCVPFITSSTNLSPAYAKQFKFSVLTSRNKTGHWTSQVQMNYGADKRDRGPWEVDIDHKATKCEEDESILIVTTVTAPPKRPGPDYELIPGLGYYKFHKTGKTWEEARDTCFQEGAYLATPNSENEELAMRSLWRRHPREKLKQYIDYIFVGFHDQFQQGDYITIFDEPLLATGYVKWASGEPSNSPKEDCGSLDPGSGYNDIKCTDVLPFICKQDL